LLPILARTEARIGASRSRLTWGAMYGHYLPYGASWTARRGAFTWALSAHTVPNQDLRVGSAAIEWAGVPFSLAAALEGASDGAVGGKVQIRADLGDLTGGVTGFVTDTPGFGDLAEGFLTWRAPGGRLTLSALVEVPFGSGDRLAVVAAGYDLGNGGRAVFGLSESGGEPAASFGIDWTF